MIDKKNKSDKSNANNRTYNINDMLILLSEATQQKSTLQTIGQYTVNSGEMVRTHSGDEFHVITNEMHNYDFTPMSSLTIALNTQKGVHYCYYGEENQADTVKKFKEKIISFYRKSFQARKDVVAWIRMTKCKNKDIEFFFNQYNLQNSSISSIIKFLLFSVYDNTDLFDEFISTYKQINTNRNICSANTKNRVLEWSSGKGFTDENDIYSFINNLKLCSKPFLDRELNNNPFIKDFCDIVDLLDKMKLLTQWQSRGLLNNPKDSEIEELMDYFRFVNIEDARETIIAEPIERWLKPNNRFNEKGELIKEVQCGEVPCSDEQINEWLDNIHFCKIKNNAPFYLCYSFTLFLCGNGPAACWYTTYQDCNHNGRRVIDNDLFMVDFDQTDSAYKKIENCYKGLIENNPETLSELRKFDSRIIEKLGVI